MKNKIKHWLSAPIFENDEEKTWRASLLNVMIIAYTLIVIVVIGSSLIGGRIKTGIYVIEGIALLVLFLFRRMLLSGKVKLAGIGVISIGIILVTIGIATVGSVHTPATMVFVLLVICAGLLFDKWGLVLSTVSSSVIVLGLISAENAGMLPQPDYSVKITQWLIYSIVFGLTGALVNFSLHTTRQALKQIIEESTKRKQVDDALKARTRELELHNRINQVVSSTLDLDVVLNAILEGTRNLLDVTICSVWLTEPGMDGLVCRQATDPGAEVVQGWHLSPGEGIAGWVAQNGESLIVPDAQIDDRYSRDIEKATGLRLHSILCVPLRVKGKVIGVIEATDTEANLFVPADMRLIELMATSAAIAIENAQLYEQAQREITERLQVEAKNTRLATVIEQATVTVVITDLAGDIIYANPNFEISTRYTIDEALGQNPRILKSGDKDDSFYKELWDTITSGNTWHGIFNNKRKNGEAYYEEATIFPIKNASGEIINFAAVKREITEQIQVEAALRESEKLKSAVIENSPIGISVRDKKGTLLIANNAWRDIWNVSEDDFKQDAIPRDKLVFDERDNYLREHLSEINKVYETGGKYYVPEAKPLKLRPGQAEWVAQSFYAIEDDEGNVDKVVVLTDDITERKHAKEALQQYTTRLETLSQVGLDITSQLELDALLRSIVTHAVNLLDGVGGGVYLYRPNLDALEWMAGVNDSAVAGTILRRGEGMAGKVWESKKSMIVDDYKAWEGRLAIYDEFDLGAVIESPIQWRGEFLGVLNIQGGYNHVFSEADVDLLNLFASQAAIAIINARLYEQAQQDAKTKALLLQDVNHRVGNNLASILGILALEIRCFKQGSVDPREILQDLQDRIRGLSIIHRMLSSAEWTPLNLERLITNVIQAALSASPIRQNIELNVEPPSEAIMVTPRQSTNLALVINELTTNSIKYAFTGRSQGRINVQIMIDNSEGNLVAPRDVIVRFYNDGPHWPNEVLRGELERVGLKIVRMAIDSLGGQLTLSNINAEDGQPGAVAEFAFKHELSA